MSTGKSPEELLGEYATPLLKDMGGDDRQASNDNDMRDWRSVSGASNASNR